MATPELERYRTYGKEMVDYIVSYYETLESKRVYPSIEPGYLRPLIPKDPPKKPEEWSDIMRDVDEKIMPGITHWQHPRFHAYFPNGNGYPSLLAGMLSDAIGCVGFSWASSPACTELETIVMDWIGKALGLPNQFLYFEPNSSGGGVIQGSASECVLVSMLAARAQAIQYLKDQSSLQESEDSIFLPRLVAYCSKEAHSCVEKAAKISLVKIRLLEADENCSMRGPTVADAIKKDREEGLHPFFVSCTLGSTSSCAFDNLKEIGPVVNNLPACWMHVDGAYAGGGFVCPELRYLKEGLEFADTFNTNCNKWMTITFDCSLLFFKERGKLTQGLVVDPLYLRHENQNVCLDYRHFQIPLSRRFRALKIWFTFREYGIEGLQAYVRNHIKLAKEFEKLMLSDERFEVVNNVVLGLVCFRLKGSDLMNQSLLSAINKEAKIHMIPSKIHDRYMIRFCVIHPNSKKEDMEYAFSVIQKHATEQLSMTKRKMSVAFETDEAKTRMSFVADVPKELLAQINRRETLKDGATPIFVRIAETSEESSTDDVTNTN